MLAEYTLEEWGDFIGRFGIPGVFVLAVIVVMLWTAYKMIPFCMEKGAILTESHASFVASTKEQGIVNAESNRINAEGTVRISKVLTELTDMHKDPESKFSTSKTNIALEHSADAMDGLVDSDTQAVKRSTEKMRRVLE